MAIEAELAQSLFRALLEEDRPSCFFEALREEGKLEAAYPELYALIGVEQNPKHHSEGDVWTHTMMVIDAAAALREGAQNPLGFMLAAVAHDVGKAVCTELVKGEIHAYGHEVKGLPLAGRLLSRVTDDEELKRYALNLIEYHMKPNAAARAGSSVKSTNKMFDQSVDPEAMILLALSDDRGKISAHQTGDNGDFLYERLRIYREYMARPAVGADDLIRAGLTQETDFSELLAHAHKLHLAGVEKESALKQTLALARKGRRKAPLCKQCSLTRLPLEGAGAEGD